MKTTKIEKQKNVNITTTELYDISKKTFKEYQPQLKKLLEKMHKDLQANLHKNGFPLGTTTTDLHSWSSSTALSIAAIFLEKEINFEIVMSRLKCSCDTPKSSILKIERKK